MAKVADVCKWMRQWAPEESCESWDNVGLLIGSAKDPIHRVLVALDLDTAVLEEAAGKGADMIVTHHPLIFHGMKQIREDQEESRLVYMAVRNGIAVYAAHTNLDAAHPGVNDALAERLGLLDVRWDPRLPMACIGRLPAPMSLPAWKAWLSEKLESPWVRFCGRTPDRVERVAVLGGSGGDVMEEAASLGVDAYVTGEIKYHDALRAQSLGLLVCETGHYWSEYPVISHIVNHLQSCANAVQYNIEFLCSETVTCPYFRE